MSKMIEVDANNFIAEVLDAPVPVLVDFSAAWCGPCRALKPVLEGMSAEANGRFKVVVVDIDNSQELAIEHQIASVPTLLVYKNGQTVNRLVGLQSKENLFKALGQ